MADARDAIDDIFDAIIAAVRISLDARSGYYDDDEFEDGNDGTAAFDAEIQSIKDNLRAAFLRLSAKDEKQG